VKSLAALQGQRWLILTGTGIALFGDVIDFFSDLLARPVLLAGLVLFASVTLWLCWRVFGDGAPQGDPPKEPTDCPECNATRFGGFACIAFGVLTLIGNGGSATATVGEQLGLIQQDIDEIQEVLEPQTIIDDPETMAEHFNNAFVYRTYRQDAVNAARSMADLYAIGAPRKLDAAQLYFDTQSAVAGRASVLAAMKRIGEASGDATLLVVAARNVASNDERRQLVARARQLAPDMPFVWWDPMMPEEPPLNAFTNPGDEGRRLRQRIAEMEKAQALANAVPSSTWLYMPGFYGDYGTSGQMLIDTYKRSAQQYEDMESGKFQRDIREKLKREQSQAK